MNEEELIKRIQILEEQMEAINRRPSYTKWISVIRKYKLLLFSLLFIPFGIILAATVTKPHTFTSGEKVSASKVNENFDTLYAKVNENTPTGTILAFAGTNVPSGWLLCNGSAVSRTTYDELFKTIGTAFGNGDGSTTFHIPDFRGRFLRGLDGTAGNDPDKNSRTSLNGGNAGNLIGSYQDDAFQGHNRTLVNSSGNYDMIYPNGSGTSHTYINILASQETGNYNDLLITKYYSSDGTNGTPRYTSETRPKNVYVNFIIKF